MISILLAFYVGFALATFAALRLAGTDLPLATKMAAGWPVIVVMVFAEILRSL